MEIVPAAQRRKVLVVGGGPAGMEAARVAGLRGHRVVLIEKEAALGGTVRVLSDDPGRRIFGALPRYLAGELERAGVEVRTGCEATVEMVVAAAPDVVLVATGGRPHVPDVPGIHDRRVRNVFDVLGGAPVGQRVLVLCELDDHLAGPTIADFLSGQGKDVEIVSEQVDFASGAENATRYMLLERLLSRGVKISMLTRLMRLDDGCATLRGTFSREERRVEVDSVVIAAGQRADDRLARALRGKVESIQLIGDCLAPRRIVHAMLDGARAAHAID
jgi:pyruvate/2-oxoglutarate dehydrogenase complex dihydrolipoamide dehydrogenase (E3) component